jgi:gliding motility-associated lipoprotein GldH
MKKTCLILLAPLIFCLSSCDKAVIYEENQQIPDKTWKQSEKFTFSTELTDTKSDLNIYLNIRNTGSYQYSNLFLFIKTVLPDGTASIDTAECTLAKPDGEWLGTGLADVWSIQVPFKKRIRIFKPGKYQFVVEQAMRIDPLPGIQDIGIRIEKSGTK